jgi:PPOX class probable F420-dependent enzyme
VAALSDDIRQLFEGPNFGHLATVMPDGSPHTVPVWVGLEGERVAFFTQEGSQKAKNLEREPRCAISITDFEHPYRSARVRGRVVERLTGEDALEVMDRIARRYTGEDFPMRSGVVFVIEPERAGFTELPFRHSPPA